MKNALLAVCGICLAVCFFSCQKTDTSDLSTLALDIESKKVNAKKELFIGKEYQGGIIYWLDETGRHGLIVAKEDLGPAPWGCYGTEIPEARSWDDGKTNSQAILANCAEPGIAARLCDEYVAREKGNHGKKYDDWYMPSFGEFSRIMIGLKGLSGLCDKTYLVSTEAYGSFQAYPINSANSAWRIAVACAPSDPNIWGNFPAPGWKSGALLVRPVRSF